MQVPGISRPALAVMIAVAAVLFVFGATRASGLLTRHTDTHTRTFAAAPTSSSLPKEATSRSWPPTAATSG
jgi:hypothetical protein